MNTHHYKKQKEVEKNLDQKVVYKNRLRAATTMRAVINIPHLALNMPKFSLLPDEQDRRGLFCLTSICRQVAATLNLPKKKKSRLTF